MTFAGEEREGGGIGMGVVTQPASGVYLWVNAAVRFLRAETCLME